MDTSPTTCRTLERYYHVNSNTLDKQYKDVLSDYRTWSELEHADEWLVFPDNVGRNLAIDETSMSNGELRTIVTNRDRHGKDQCLVAIVKGVKSEDVINALKHIPEALLNMVEEVTLDLSDSMRKIVRTCFPKAMRVIDRFHIQKLACDAVQEMRIKHRWDAIQEANDDMEEKRAEIDRAASAVDSGAGVVLLTDMFGGTPSNLAISLLGRPNLEVIAGVNLPMLIKLASVRKAKGVGEAVDLAQEAGRKYISVASRLLGEAA